jgi:arylamine N-acetyltransferase
MPDGFDLDDGRRGGYCFEQNTLFQAALEALGHRVSALAAGRETWLGGIGHRLRAEQGLWVLEGNVDGTWTDLYAFTLEPQHPVDFETGSSTATIVRDPDHLLEILDSVFGLAFPPGTRFARPEF